MGPNELAIVLGLLTNGLYSLILFTGHTVGKKVEDLAFREENIQERLMKDKTIFVSIFEATFRDLPPVIEQEEFCEFLGRDQTKDIVERIYSFNGFASENPYSLETIKIDFFSLLSQYFSGREGISAIAPQLFSILIMCCQKSLEIIIKEDQDLSALDIKLIFYFKDFATVLNNYHDNLYQEIKANQESLDKLHIEFNKIEKGLKDLPKRIKLELQSSYSSRIFINMAPNLESDFIKRDTEYQLLVEGLLNNRSNEMVAITTALRGAGGFGKTTLAKAVCYDQRIIERFSDGILWVTLGESPGNLVPYVNDLISCLSKDNQSFGTLDSATSFLKDLISEKRVLIVIDDAWDSAHLKPFLRGGSYCAHLITTRNDDTLPPEASRIFVDSMLEKEAIEMLRYGLACKNGKSFNELAERLGYWPLLLKIVNSTLQYRVNQLNESVDKALEYINNGLDEEGLTAFDKENPESRSQAVDATFAVSLKALNKEECSLYYELAIFPKDINIPLKVLEKLWNKDSNFSPFRVKRFCTKLYSMSLLQTYDTKNDFIKLHDVVREYLLSKQRKNLPLLNSQFLDAFKINKWEDLSEKEAYLWKNLSYHFVGAERKDELRKLLLDFNWIQSKLNTTDVHFLLNDYDYFYEDYPVEMIKGAILLSANVLSRDKKLLEGQLLGRLESFSEPEIWSMMKYIRTHRSRIRILPLTCSLTPPGGPLLRTLEGHSGSVNSVCVTPYGNYAVSGSDDKTLKVWDLNTGKEVRTLEGHSGSVNSICVIPNENYPDENYAVSASSDKTLKVWDLKTGEEVCTLTGHSSGVTAVTITPNRRYAVSASDDSMIKVWDLKTWKEVCTLIGHSSRVNAVSIDPDGNYMSSASNDQTLKIWDLKTWKEVNTLTHWAGALAITPDGNQIFSGSWEDYTLRVWDLKRGKEVHRLRGHSLWVNAISITPDGNYAVSASYDSTLKVWDLKTWKEIQTLRGHYSMVKAVSVTPDGNYAVSASGDSTLKVWGLNKGKEVRALTGHSSWVSSISITPDGNYAVSASCDTTLKVWDLKTRKEIHTLEGHSGWVTSIYITPDGNQVVSGSDDRTLKVWDLNTGKEVSTLEGYSGRIKSVFVTPNGKYVISILDSTLKVWDLKTGKEIKTLTEHSDLVSPVFITPDGDYAVSASSDNIFKMQDFKKGKVWNLKTGKEIRTLTGHSDIVVNSVSVISDRNYNVSISNDGMLKVWDLKTGKEISAFCGESPFLSFALSPLSPDGTIVIAGEESGRVHFLQFER